MLIRKKRIGHFEVDCFASCHSNADEMSLIPELPRSQCYPCSKMWPRWKLFPDILTQKSPHCWMVGLGNCKGLAYSKCCILCVSLLYLQTHVVRPRIRSENWG